MPEDQNTFQSKKFGALTFFPAKDAEWKNTCRHCLLYHSEKECLQAACTTLDRQDGREGYFAIHQMPEKNEG